MLIPKSILIASNAKRGGSLKKHQKKLIYRKIEIKYASNFSSAILLKTMNFSQFCRNVLLIKLK